MIVALFAVHDALVCLIDCSLSLLIQEIVLQGLITLIIFPLPFLRHRHCFSYKSSIIINIKQRIERYFVEPVGGRFLHISLSGYSPNLDCLSTYHNI